MLYFSVNPYDLFVLTYLELLCIIYLDVLGMRKENIMDQKLMTIGTSMLILKLLSEQDMYGYQIIKELEQRSNHVFDLKEGTLYPVLHALEVKLAIQSYNKTAENGRIRKYYKITETGLKLSCEKEKEWNSYKKTIDQIIGGDLYA